MQVNYPIKTNPHVHKILFSEIQIIHFMRFSPEYSSSDN